VDEDAAVAWFAGKAIFHRELEVGILLVGDEVAVGRSQADDHSVPGDETGLEVGLVVGGRDVGVPTGEILAVEKGDGLTFALLVVVGESGGREEGCEGCEGEEEDLHGLE
jgi:hypothetical protein